MDSTASGPGDRAKNEARLLRNSAKYEALLEAIGKLHPVRHAPTVLRCLERLAAFAGYNHPGRFADGKFENIGLEIGRNLERIAAHESAADEAFNLPIFQAKGKRHLLHVASTVYPIGGHTRLLRKWIAADTGSRHSVLLTRQGQHEIPDYLTQAIAGTEGELIVLPSQANLVSKAKWLRRAVRRGVDVVVLHHHPDDVIPLVAFATTDNPPVAVLNHCDHLFWVGVAIADIVIQLRPFSIAFSEQRRLSRNNVLLPIPLEDRLQEPSRIEARQQLGIREDEVMILSIGRKEKYRPSREHNFFRTTRKILDLNQHARLFLVGISEENAKIYAGEPNHARLHCVGPVADPASYRAAADVYIESFPEGSQTALLEAALAGLPTILAYGPSSFLSTNDEAINDIGKKPLDEQTYIEQTTFLVRHAVERRKLGTLFRERMLARHIGNGWLDTLRSIYNRIDGLQHQPCPIEHCPCMATEEDITLCDCQQALEVVTEVVTDVQEEVARELLGMAYHAREEGQFSAALQLLRESTRRSGRRVSGLFSIAKLFAHWLVRRAF